MTILEKKLNLCSQIYNLEDERLISKLEELVNEAKIEDEKPDEPSVINKYIDELKLLQDIKSGKFLFNQEVIKMFMDRYISLSKINASPSGRLEGLQ